MPAVTTARPGSFKTFDLDDVRTEFTKTFRQIAFLRRKQDNGRKGRFSLMTDIAASIGTLSNECDLPCGYTDEADPFACDALDILRADFDELRGGSYPFAE